MHGVGTKALNLLYFFQSIAAVSSNGRLVIALDRCSSHIGDLDVDLSGSVLAWIVDKLVGVIEGDVENMLEDAVSKNHVVKVTKLITIQSTLDISKLWGLIFTSSNYPKCKLICTSGNLDL